MNRIKEKISFLKLWLTFLVTINVGSVAWLFNQESEINVIKFTATSLLIFLTFIIIAIITKKIYKLIKTIED